MFILSKLQSVFIWCPTFIAYAYNAVYCELMVFSAQ